MQFIWKKPINSLQRTTSKRIKKKNYIDSSQTRNYIHLLATHQVFINLSKLQVFFATTFGSYTYKLYPKLDLNPIFFIKPKYEMLITNKDDAPKPQCLNLFSLPLSLHKFIHLIPLRLITPSHYQNILSVLEYETSPLPY